MHTRLFPTKFTTGFKYPTCFYRKLQPSSGSYKCWSYIQPALHFVLYLLTKSMQQSLSWEATCLQLLKKFPAFYGTRMFITAFTSARHLSLSWASSIQSIPSHPTSWRTIFILSSHLRLCIPSGLFPTGFPPKSLYTPLFSPIRATCPAHLILLHFFHPNNIRWSVHLE